MRREGLNPLPYTPNNGGGGDSSEIVIVDNDDSSPIPVVGTIDIGNTIDNPIPTEVLNDSAVNKYLPGVRQTRVFMISTAGDNILITPSAGTKLRVYWVGYSSSETNTMEVLASLRFGNGPDIYGWFLGAPGAFSHWEPITGEVDGSLIINLSQAQPIQVNITYEEIK